jgi:CheY-like chemotaxis protein
MNKDTVILLAEDDNGHAGLIMKNLKRAGIENEIILFKNGQETIDFLFQKGPGPKRKDGIPYVLLLDIRMPKIDGIEVLRRVKEDEKLSAIPVIMVTTTDEQDTIDKCYSMGCMNYIVKPVDYEEFVDAIRKLGRLLQMTEIPEQVFK